MQLPLALSWSVPRGGGTGVCSPFHALLPVPQDSLECFRGTTPEYPTHPTVLGLGLRLGLWIRIRVRVRLSFKVRVGIRVRD